MDFFHVGYERLLREYRCTRPRFAVQSLLLKATGGRCCQTRSSSSLMSSRSTGRGYDVGASGRLELEPRRLDRDVGLNIAELKLTDITQRVHQLEATYVHS